MHDIPYEYEAPYYVSTADAEYPQYRPDFSFPDLSDRKLYLEHFALDKQGRSPFPGYTEKMKWKRELHQRHGTVLLETHSYQFEDGSWIDSLMSQLESHGITPRPLSRERLDEVLASFHEQRKQLVDVIVRFMHLAEERGCTPDNLLQVLSPADDRERAFLNIFSHVYVEYDLFLKKNQLIDFGQMLLRAAEYIESGAAVRKLKYIIVDEFQDITPARARLLQVLQKTNPGMQVFAVGDDWQSIFRFGGSDVSLMENFAINFGFTKELFLEESHRFGANIAATLYRGSALKVGATFVRPCLFCPDIPGLAPMGSKN